MVAAAANEINDVADDNVAVDDRVSVSDVSLFSFLQRNVAHFSAVKKRSAAAVLNLLRRAGNLNVLRSVGNQKLVEGKMGNS